MVGSRQSAVGSLQLGAGGRPCAWKLQQRQKLQWTGCQKRISKKESASVLQANITNAITRTFLSLGWLGGWVVGWFGGAVDGWWLASRLPGENVFFVLSKQKQLPGGPWPAPLPTAFCLGQRRIPMGRLNIVDHSMATHTPVATHIRTHTQQPHTEKQGTTFGDLTTYKNKKILCNFLYSQLK